MKYEIKYEIQFNKVIKTVFLRTTSISFADFH